MTASTPPTAIEVFFSYAHEDEALRDKLANHLKLLERQGVIRKWHDRQIGGGHEWAGEIDSHLNSAQVILLLISSDFLASDYCYDLEMKRAMDRHETREARVVPIILRPVDWKGSPFSKLQGFPKDGKPVTSWANRDEAFVDIARGIRAVVEELTQPADKKTPNTPRQSGNDINQPSSQSDRITPSQDGAMSQSNYGNSTGYQTKVDGGTVYVGGTHIYRQSASAISNQANTAKTILVLAANPKDTTPIRLDQEVRNIQEGLRQSSQRDRFVLEQRWAVRSRDVRRAMLEVKPHIVHFSGHGSDDGSLMLEDEVGNVKFVAPEALAGLFELFADQVECVLLNACYSENQADAIAQHIPYVIGMSDEIDDEASIEFAVAFYDALGAGKSIEFAYKLGCSAIQMAGIEGHLIPILKSGKQTL